ncbi:MAG TPA: DUF262 domain-containing protein, partial [Blastocatellia bacterium]|nr:DUF262 domain-containing protein [Blastocatellia bacterium]
FFSIYCIKAGYLLKKSGVWYLTPKGEGKLELGDIGLLDSASVEYRKWREENQEAGPDEAEDLTEEGPTEMNYRENVDRSEMEVDMLDDTEVEGDGPEREDAPDIAEEYEIEATVDGTEYEDAGITKPFNPTLINILTKQMSMDTLIKRMREGEVNLSPDFQRSEVWKPTARSRLVESLLIRIPLPAFYMDATNEDNWLVVDGLQRLSTLRDFVIKDQMKLRDLEFLTQFHGHRHSQLPRSYQRRIEETQVTVYLIDKGTPSEVKFNIFKRINTGGLPLSPQEIRHALNQGPVTPFLKVLADSDGFREATGGGVNDKRMTARECVLRFFAFTLTPPDAYRATDFDAFLSDAMASLNAMSNDERRALGQRFVRALEASKDVFGDSAFRKPKRMVKSPVNKALFETCTVSLDKQTDEALAILRVSSQEVIRRIEALIQDDREFLSAISQSTGDPAKVRLRFTRFREVVEGCLR